MFAPVSLLSALSMMRRRSHSFRKLPWLSRRVIECGFIDQATQDTANQSVEAIVNLRTEEAFKLRQAGAGPPNHGAIAVEAQSDYATDPPTYRRGKIVLGRLIPILQKELGANPRIYFPS